MQDVVATALAEETFRAALSALLGAIGLVLSLVGVIALVVRWVADRRRDLGIRIALGATPADVRSLVLRRAGIAVATGISAGVPAAFAVARLLGTFLVGVDAGSVVIYVLVPIVIAILAFVGVWVPAVRASKMTPVGLLRP
jgi:ABC-type antimicrobial peptide transport system permease subunit